jgi:hypothetical protein
MVVLDHVSEESKNYKSEHRLRLLEQISEASHADEEEKRGRRGTVLYFGADITEHLYRQRYVA